MNKQTILTIIIGLLTSLLLAQSEKLGQGSGSFIMMGGANHLNDTITVFYHKPASFTAKSKILLVLPGAGRNGDSYRDSWLETSERHSVLIISPSYPEKNYNYGDYHLGGVVKDLDLRKGVSFVEGTNQVRIDEDVMEFKVNTNREEWLFNDMDKLFDLVVEMTGSNQKKYDVFGHSAGGQILHRFVLFHPNSKADRVLAGNSGTFTIPDFETEYPFGLSNTGIQPEELKKSFKKKLVLLLGELDNDSETRGTMLRSKTADKQGTSRLARGNYFFTVSQEMAKQFNMTFNWSLETVPNVGHNQKKMAQAAASYLYGEE